jgi:hypothetical protein
VLSWSRNTVRRYLRSETIEPAYAERRPSRAIDKYAFQLSALLKTEAAKSRKQTERVNPASKRTTDGKLDRWGCAVPDS